MVFKTLLITLTAFFITPARSFANSEFCQKMVIKDCASNFNEFLEALKHGRRNNTIKDKCTGLQESIDCLSIPSCSGDLLKSFRSLFLVTATVIKSSNMCPNLKYRILQEYVQGDAMSCKGTKVVRDKCQRKCMCYQGELILCHRERKEFTAMRLEERRRFIDTLKTAASNPVYRDEYTRLSKIHAKIPSRLLHHLPEIFLPWHRWFLSEFENFLRQIDCRVTIPFWDWSKDSEHWARGSETRDVWSPDQHGLGGDGALTDGCVKGGPFGKGQFYLPENIGNNCLKRHFNVSCFLPDRREIESAINESNFALFERTVRETFHPALHDCVGGHMSKHLFASFTPEFWIHHSFIDKLWDDWQKRGDKYKFQYFMNVSFEMPAARRFPWEFLDNHNLPGDVRIIYVDGDKSENGSRLENFV